MSGAVGALMVGAAAGVPCGAKAEEAGAGAGYEWDDEADFVVLGSGTALTGALKAASEGMSVIVLEKSDLVGGTTLLSGGQVWIPCNDYCETPDDRELAKTYMTKVAAGLSTEAIIDAYIDRGAEMARFLTEAAGVVWSVSPRIDYHAQWEGASRDTRSLACTVDGVTSGATFIEPEAQALEALGGRIFTSTPAKRLVSRLDADGANEILGVIAEGPDGSEMWIKANKGVLIGTGGFSYNEDMIKAYHPIPQRGCMCVAGSTGDGILMAQAVGANLVNMPWGWGLVAFKGLAEQYFDAGVCSTSVGLYAYQSKPCSIFVNRQGKRFCDEASDYDSVWYGFQGQSTTGEMELTNVPAFYVCDQTVRDALSDPSKGDTFFNVLPDEELPSWGYQADTIEELAEKAGIDPEGLKATIEKYNEGVKNGVDTEFHRGESEFETYNLMNSGPTLGALETPPFYAAEIIPVYQGTKGGIQINEYGQAMSSFGKPIARLYACGNTTGCGGPGKYYTGAGGTNGPGMIFAYIAAEHASQLEAWE